MSSSAAGAVDSRGMRRPTKPAVATMTATHRPDEQPVPAVVVSESCSRPTTPPASSPPARPAHEASMREPERSAAKAQPRKRAGRDHADGGARRVGALGRRERQPRVRARVDGARDDPGAEAEQEGDDRLARAAREEADRERRERSHDAEEDRLLEDEVADGQKLVAVERRAVDEVVGEEVGGEGGQQRDAAAARTAKVVWSAGSGAGSGAGVAGMTVRRLRRRRRSA